MLPLALFPSYYFKSAGEGRMEVVFSFFWSPLFLLAMMSGDIKQGDIDPSFPTPIKG